MYSKNLVNVEFITIRNELNYVYDTLLRVLDYLEKKLNGTMLYNIHLVKNNDKHTSD